MYTIVNYLYRDASNYKRLNQVCFLGTLSEHQKARIIGSLYEGEYFIPSAIGWDEEWISADYNDDDGCWFELTKDDFFEVPGKPAYIVFDERTPVEIVQTFCSADWESHMGDWKM